MILIKFIKFNNKNFKNYKTYFKTKKYVIKIEIFYIYLLFQCVCTMQYVVYVKQLLVQK